MADINFRCPYCQKSLQIDEQGAGMQVQCPGCNKSIVVPHPVSAAPAPSMSPAYPSRGVSIPPAGGMRPQTPPHNPNAMNGPKTSSGAVWSLVLGILGFVCLGLFTGIPAIICGHVARGNIRRSNGALKGEGMALAGLIMGYVVTIISFVLLALVLAGAMVTSSALEGALRDESSVEKLKDLIDDASN